MKEKWLLIGINLIFIVVFDNYYIHNEFHEHHPISIWDFKYQ